jgi:hypothetical protein
VDSVKGKIVKERFLIGTLWRYPVY